MARPIQVKPADSESRGGMYPIRTGKILSTVFQGNPKFPEFIMWACVFIETLVVLHPRSQNGHHHCASTLYHYTAQHVHYCRAMVIVLVWRLIIILLWIAESIEHSL